MIVALLIGRKGSVGYPGKNTTLILNRMLSEYPIIHAQNSKYIDRIYLSTDDDQLVSLGKKHGIENIERPPELCTKEALGEDVFNYGYKKIKEKNPDEQIDLVVLLFCNAVTFLSSHIDEGIEILLKNSTYDSAVTVSQYNWYSPARARSIGQDGLLQPFIPFENFPKMDISCDRDAQGDVFFADVCVSVVRPICLENPDYGMLPQKWMGQKIAPIHNWGGLDVDKKWQMPLVEYWLKENGFTDSETPYR